jgi:hypothetical protein
MSYLFAVALFIRNNPLNIKTSIIEKLLLYTLAGRIGYNEKTWISQLELSHEMQISERHLRRAIANMSKLGIILIKKKWRSNHYFLDKNTLLAGHRSPVKEDVSPDTDVLSEGLSPDIHDTITGLTSPLINDKNALQVVESEEEKSTKKMLKVTNKINNKIKVTISCARFDEFWGVYPRKIAPKVARKKWTTLKCDKIADEIISDVKARNATEWATKEKQFIPHPSTYLHQERWKDEPEGLANAKVSGHSKLTHRQTVHKRNWDRLKNWN